MERKDELREIYEKSGLKGLLYSTGIDYHEDRDFTKLNFEPGVSPFRSIELWDLKRGGTYFRIHYSTKTAQTSPWLIATMQKWEGWRKNSPEAGLSFDGDPLKHAKSLADLLRSKK